MKKFILHKNPDDRQRVQANAIRCIQELPQEHAHVIEIKRHVKTRSQAQNATLWGVVYPPIMGAMGLRGERDREELHEYWCGEYFGWVEYEIMGKRKQRPRRTTTTNEDGRRDVLSVPDFMDFVEFIQQRSAEHGIHVPDPDPMHRQHTEPGE